MPVKRRQPKVRKAYPEPIQRLLDGKPITPSPEAREQLIGFAYLYDHREIDDETLRYAALEIILGWPAY